MIHEYHNLLSWIEGYIEARILIHHEQGNEFEQIKNKIDEFKIKNTVNLLPYGIDVMK